MKSSNPAPPNQGQTTCRRGTSPTGPALGGRTITLAGTGGGVVAGAPDGAVAPPLGAAVDDAARQQEDAGKHGRPAAAARHRWRQRSCALAVLTRSVLALNGMGVPPAAGVGLPPAAAGPAATTSPTALLRRQLPASCRQTAWPRRYLQLNNRPVSNVQRPLMT